MENNKLDLRGPGYDSKSLKNVALLTVRRVIAYLILIILSLMCLFTIYILIVNSTRPHTAIQQGFSLIPGTDFFNNFKSLQESGSPIVRGFINSLVIAFLSGFLCAYFSAWTAYGIHMYNFKLKNVAFVFILKLP